jgi:formyl-CoA transferase
MERLADDPRFSTNPVRVTHRHELIPMLEEVFRKKTRDEWLDILIKAEVPVGPVYSLEEVFSDPEVLERKMRVRMRHPAAGEISQIGIPMKFSETGSEIKSPPPLLGEHVDEVLSSLLGYGEAKIRDLRSHGIV